MKRVKIKKRKEKEKKTKRKEKEKRKERKVQCLVRSKMFVVSDLVFWQNVECTTTIIITITMIVILLLLIIIVIFITSTIINFILVIIFVLRLLSRILFSDRNVESTHLKWGPMGGSMRLCRTDIIINIFRRHCHHYNLFVIAVLIAGISCWLLEDPIQTWTYLTTPSSLWLSWKSRYHDLKHVHWLVGMCRSSPRPSSSLAHDWDDLHSPLEGPQGACATP